MRSAGALLIALLVVLTGLKAAEPAAEKTIAARLAAIETRVGGRLGVAAIESSSGRKIEHHAQERFPLCSTFKFLAAAAVLHRVNENQDQLTRVVPYTEADLLEHAPVTREHVKDGGMTLSRLAAAAIIRSDNTAGNLLLRTIGGPAGLTRYARTLGDKKTRLDRIEPDLNSALPGDERDTTTPAATLGNMRALLIANALSDVSRALLDSWLAANQTGGDLIRAGVPNDWKVGDKTGRGGNGAINDIAILRPPGREPILLAIYLVGSTASAEVRQAAIADVARLVAETFAK